MDNLLLIFVFFSGVYYIVFHLIYSVWVTLAIKKSRPPICKTLKRLLISITIINIFNVYCVIYLAYLMQFSILGMILVIPLLFFLVHCYLLSRGLK